MLQRFEGQQHPTPIISPHHPFANLTHRRRRHHHHRRRRRPHHHNHLLLISGQQQHSGVP